MGKIRDKIWDEAEAAPAPVLAATTLQNCAIQFEINSIVHCANPSDAVRLQTLCPTEVQRSGQTIRFIKPIMLRIFFDRSFGMCARRCL